MNLKVFALGAALGLAAAVAPSCTGSKCSVANCKGCCSSDGKCVADPANQNNTSCGAQGNACVDCAKTNQVCNKSTYQCGVTSNNLDAGPSCGGCTTENGFCLEVTNATNCGINGSACKACDAKQYCIEGVCGVPDGGLVPGSIGAPCTSDTECTAISLQPGYQAFCKKETFPGMVTYRDGYCTRRCLDAAQCVSTGTSGNICPIYLGFAGELENVCLRGCNDDTGCRDGYACVNFGGSSGSIKGCWALQADGGLPDIYDAGPPFTGAAGGACTQNAQCGPDPFFYCIPELMSDGGATGFPGGQCSGECSLSPHDLFCGDGAVCLPYLGGRDGRGPYVVWECGQRCNPMAPNCRSGYVCDQFNNEIYGTCTPDCRSNRADWCGPGTCNATTGLCN